MANSNNILSTVKTEDTWIDVETLAALKGISKRGVRSSLTSKNNSYQYKTAKVKGGTAYKIKLSSLEEEHQIKYIQEYYNDFQTSKGEIIELNNFQIKQEKLITPKQKEIALAKYDTIMCWLDFRNNYKKNKIENMSADHKFIELFNTGFLHENLYNIIGKVSYGSLYRWRASLKINDDWTALVGRYKYNAHDQYNTKLNDEQIKIFLKILLSPNGFSIGKAIGLTKHILKERGYEILPKDVTFRRYANWFKDKNYDKWVFAREGQKALKDKVEPYIVRNPKLLNPGQVLIADGHTLNAKVISPFTGKPCRATLIGFLDWRSGGLVGYDIMLNECTQNIASALRNAILKMDHIPQFVYQDNGRAFKSKFFKGDKKFEELGFTGVYQRLGIKPIYAKPYNARAKVIERFFLDFQEGFEKLLPSYIGTSIENKPAYVKRNEPFHKDLHEQQGSYVPTIEEAIKLIDEWLKYRHSLPCPNERDATIQEVLDRIPKQNIEESKLDDLMLDLAMKTIGRNGITFLNAKYFDEALYGIKGQVVIKYSLFDLTSIKVYSLNGEFICIANRVTETHPLANQLGDIKDIEDYKQKIKKQQNLKKKTLKAVKEHFKLEDIDLIKEELIKETVIDVQLEEPKEVKQKFIPKIKTSIVARPIFKHQYERYEWHMKNGCFCNEDREWFENYKQSKEYKEIYE